MAARLDNMPKQYGEGVCLRCKQTFEKPGPNTKRCEPCFREHKREYERTKKRDRHVRRVACEDCQIPFPADIHAHTRCCAGCARKRRRKALNEQQLRRHYERYAKDPAHRLNLSVSVLVRRSLRNGKAGRSWESLVGYSLSDLRNHLERQFTRGMSWDNLGEWHVDHIIPRRLFSFKSADDAEFKACWALSNLQPLWRLDNLRKNGRRLYLL